MKKLAILIIIGLFSCSKPGKNVGVKGRVVNPITNEGMPNVEVILLTSESLSLPGGFKKIKSTTTDENGNFEIYALRVFKPVWVQAEILNEYGVGWFFDGSYISDGFRARADKGKKMLADFHAVPYGNLRVHFHNQNCQGPTDTLEFYYVSAQIPFGVTGVPTIITGCINILDDPISFPMGQRNYMWKVKRNGTEQTFEGSVYVEPNSTSILEVFY